MNLCNEANCNCLLSNCNLITINLTGHFVVSHVGSCFLELPFPVYSAVTLAECYEKCRNLLDYVRLPRRKGGVSCQFKRETCRRTKKD